MLRIVLFICGAVVMSVEILASRVLAVEFGETLYSWGALIGSFIGALSLGYWLGGVAADGWPSKTGLAIITFAAGAVIAATVGFTNGISDWVYGLKISDEAALWAKPLVATVVLYAIPVTLIGAVSPYCVRLAADDLSRIGKRVGGLYAISSLGSIAGTFVTAFYLVAEFPVRATIRAEGLLLIAVSLPVFLVAYMERRKARRISGTASAG